LTILTAVTTGSGAAVDGSSYVGRRVIVTGAASGMGEATARLVTARGGEVWAVDVREPAADVARTLLTDLRDEAAIDATIAAVDEPIDAVFSCAGLAQTAPPLDVMTVNFVGARHLIEGLVPAITPGGAIACIASVAGFRLAQNQELVAELTAVSGFDAAREWCDAHRDVVGDGYSFSKMATVWYVMWRAVQLAPMGIRLNAVSPGPVETPMMPHFEAAMGKGWMDAFPKPLGRLSRADEQAEALLFCNSRGASYLTGANIYVDGGITAAWITGQAAKPVRTDPPS
jgi:NAD(P)-dependent dehydrogenase (short-subunit alcohol dehydrogenase family)